MILILASFLVVPVLVLGSPARLETRTKESNVGESRRVASPFAHEKSRSTTDGNHPAVERVDVWIDPFPPLVSPPLGPERW